MHMSKWNIASFSKEDQDKVSVDKVAAAVAGGKGGGRPDIAMAGATDVTKLEEAFAAAKEWLREKLA